MKKRIIACIISIFVIASVFATSAFASNFVTEAPKSFEVWNDGTGEVLDGCEVLPAENPSELSADICLSGKTEFEPIKKEEYYGRTMLEKERNKAVLLYVYNKLTDGISRKVEVIELDDDVYDVSYDDFLEAYNAFRFDNPQFFYNNTYPSSLPYHPSIKPNGYVLTTRINDGACADFMPYYFEDVIDEEEAFEKVADDFIKAAGVTPDMSDYEKSKRIHDRLIAITEYDYDSADAGTIGLEHTAYAALVNGYAVCDGYAKAYQYLLYKVGILAIVAGGYADGGDHAWNIVRLDGKWYMTDVTWDDPYFLDEDTQYASNEISYAYLNRSAEWFEENYHYLYADEGYDLPQCYSDDLSFYNKESLFTVTDSTNIDNPQSTGCAKLVNSIVSQVKAKPYARICDLRNNGFEDPAERYQNFARWVNTNSQAIIKGLGAKRINFSVGFFGREYHIKIFWDNSSRIIADSNFECQLALEKAGYYKAYQVFYDKDGKVIDMNTYLHLSTEKEIVSLINVPKVGGYKTVKYFLWKNSLDNRPVCDMFEMSY